jgi:putative ABC transport system substrate-binding protein
VRWPRRLGLVAACAVALVAVGAAAAQQAQRMPRIGFIGNGASNTMNAQIVGFRKTLSDLGWIEGQTASVEFRWAEGRPERLPALAADLVQAKVDILVVSGPPAVRAARDATRSIPIVFVLLVDPVDLGFAASLGRPGANITGVASQYEDIVAKQQEILAEAVPKVSRVAILRHTSSPRVVGNAAQAAARKVGHDAHLLEVASATDLEGAFKTARARAAGAMHVLPSPFFNSERRRLAELAIKYNLPAIYEFGEYVKDGGLMSYGPNIVAMYARAAIYVDRILKGANPAELPIERPTVFELVINMRTAKALGLGIPPALLSRSDQIID